MTINMPFKQWHIFFILTLDLTKYAKEFSYTVLAKNKTGIFWNGGLQ